MGKGDSVYPLTTRCQHTCTQKAQDRPRRNSFEDSPFTGQLVSVRNSYHIIQAVLSSHSTLRLQCCSVIARLAKHERMLFLICCIEESLRCQKISLSSSGVVLHNDAQTTRRLRRAIAGPYAANPMQIVFWYLYSF